MAYKTKRDKLASDQAAAETALRARELVRKTNNNTIMSTLKEPTRSGSRPNDSLYTGEGLEPTHLQDGTSRRGHVKLSPEIQQGVDAIGDAAFDAGVSNATSAPSAERAARDGATLERQDREEARNRAIDKKIKRNPLRKVSAMNLAAEPTVNEEQRAKIQARINKREAEARAEAAARKPRI